MCTLLTIDLEYYLRHTKEIQIQITSDAHFNRDGFSLIGISPLLAEANVHLQSMDIDIIFTVLEKFFDTTYLDTSARIFLHSRAATTCNVGLPYCHGFTDLNGNFIMHNGILSNPDKWAVDSFQLVNMAVYSPYKLLKKLVSKKETFANIFIISEDTYSVVRVGGGRLYTDHLGNYSTNATGDIKHPIGRGYAKTYQYPVFEEEDYLHVLSTM